jgi:ketosteroid isomerase-like protein
MVTGSSGADTPGGWPANDHRAKVHMSRVLAVVWVLGVVAGAQGDGMPAALSSMAETERAFAARAAATSVREAFIEYFADDAVAFGADPSPAREGLLASPPSPPGLALLWEPRLGDAAASGELGYLTGPYEQRVAGRPSSHGTYFSVWKRQADGTWKVIIDQGIGTPSTPTFAPGFTRSPARGAWSGQETRDEADAALATADRRFADAVASGLGPAYEAALHPDARLMRPRHQPMTSRADAIAYLTSTVKTLRTGTRKAEAARSGDLGYTWGTYEATGTDGIAVSAYYVRVWTRTADGTWLVAAEVTTK